MTSKTSYREFISKPEINFWVPIVFTAVSITISFMALCAKVDLLTQRVDQLIGVQSAIVQKYENVQLRLGIIEKQVGILESKVDR